MTTVKEVLLKSGIAIMLAALIVWTPISPGLAQGGDTTHYFPETGFAIDPKFIEFFERYGGLELFGYPISRTFIDQGILVQYFQNARFEYHPDNPDPYKVQLGLLGDELHYNQPPVRKPQFPSRRRVYFPETGHTVAYAFLDYFKEHGGIDVFGYPITEMYFEEGRIVQYFQRMKMEWHPEDHATPVHIGNLGELYVQIHQNRFPPEVLNPINPSAIIAAEAVATREVNALQAIVSLRYSVMGHNGEQVVSVLVTDAQGEPVEGAEVTILFIDSHGHTLKQQGGYRTDGRGLVSITIPVNGGNAGEEVVVRAEITYGSATTEAENVFLLWW